MKPRRRFAPVAAGPLTLVGLAVVLAAGCSSARRVPPVAPSSDLTAHPDAARGEVLFQRYCHSCHPHGEGGLGPALNNKPLPGFLTRFQVRHGLGTMPAFSEEILPAPDLDAIVAYLAVLRANGPVTSRRE